MKILFYDIETAPLLAHVWHLWGDFVSQDQLLADSFMLTWGAKWADSGKILSDKLTSEEAQAQDDSRIVESLAKLVREADIIVAHNGDKFDLPILNKRLFLLGLEPLPPVKTIDTLKLAKRSFRMESNKLDFLADRLGLGRKTKTDFLLWREAYQGDEKAIAKMDRYCRRDVRLLEEIFNRMKPYVKGLPRLVDGPGHKCPTCNGTNLRKQGRYYTNAGTFQRWQCKECGRYSRSPASFKEFRPELRPL